MASDFELLDHWGAGDTAAGEELFERYFDAMYRFFNRKASGEVSDLVQRTVLASVEGRERFRREASFRTYLYGVARNEICHHWRQVKRDDALDFSTTTLHDVDPTPSVFAAKKQEDRILLEALRRIPLDLQISVELHYWEGLTGPQIASVLGIPEGTTRSRLRRALEALRASVQEVSTSTDQLKTTMAGLDDCAERLRVRSEE